jgi:CHAP domain
MSSGLPGAPAGPGAIASGVKVGLALVGVLFVTAGMVVVTMLSGSLPGKPSCETGVSTTLPRGSGTVVAATVYDDEGLGAYSLGLTGHYPFAELGLHSETDTNREHADRIGVALGLGHPLAPLTKLEILAPGGHTVIAEKRDIGMGGAPIDGHPRAIDLWTTTREKLGLGPDWSGLVRVAPGPTGELTAETSALSESSDPLAGSGEECGEGSAPVSGGNRRIVEIAREEVGYTHISAGWYCTKFGPCEEWCALFVTWVWAKAGIAIPSLAFSGAVYDWSKEHTNVYPPSTRPRPGWAVLFGSGPESPSTSLHVAIVESVLPEGKITIINGDFDGQVMRTGPCLPADATAKGPVGCDAPGPIYGYASPT